VQGDALQQQLAAVFATGFKRSQQLRTTNLLDGIASAWVQGDALQQQLAAVSATEGKLRQELEAAASEAAELRGQVAALQQQVSGLQGEVGKKQTESEAFAAGGLGLVLLHVLDLCCCDSRERACIAAGCVCCSLLQLCVLDKSDGGGRHIL
jgi:hypothetical protein